MSLTRRFIIWTSIAVTLLWMWPNRSIISSDSDIHTHRFCAYGSIYVEFERDGKVWGTTYLDYKGRPVSCEEEERVRETVGNVI